jgi:hypothetical protein
VLLILFLPSVPLLHTLLRHSRHTGCLCRCFYGKIRNAVKLNAKPQGKRHIHCANSFSDCYWTSLLPFLASKPDGTDRPASPSVTTVIHRRTPARDRTRTVVTDLAKLYTKLNRSSVSDSRDEICKFKHRQTHGRYVTNWASLLLEKKKTISPW